VRSHQSRVERQNHLPRHAGHTSFDAAHGTVGLLSCKSTLPGHDEFLMNQHPQLLFLRAALNSFSAQSVYVLRSALSHVQNLALGLVKLSEGSV